MEPADKPAFIFSGKVRYNIARNLKTFRVILEGVEEIRVKLAKEKAIGLPEMDDKGRAEFIKEFTEVLDLENDVQIFPVTVADLDLDKNQIHLPILTELLGTIIVES